MTTETSVFRARIVCPSADELIEDGGIVVAGGRVSRVLRSADEVRRAASSGHLVDLGDVLLTPGLVNAHAHLELGALRGLVDPGNSFPDWIRGLLVARAGVGLDELQSGLVAGAGELSRSGCTSVGDIDSLGLEAANLPLRRYAFRELLDVGDAQRTQDAIASLGEKGRDLSPHAPYTVSTKLAHAIGEYAREHESRLAVHWAETLEEVEWLSCGTGPFKELLQEDAAAARGSGLDRIDSAGLLGPRTTLIHANHPADEDFARVARSGATIVHCPGTHRFFAREPFAIDRWIRAGVPIAIGTDSLASNDSLDLLREMSLLREAHPALDASEVFRFATENGACALGVGSGTLATGELADFAVFGAEDVPLSDALDALCSAQLACQGTWIGGRATTIRSSETDSG